MKELYIFDQKFMRSKIAERILSETPQETKDKVREMATEMVGINPKNFEITLDKDWKQFNYIIGYDPYEEDHIPINTYNKIKKFLGLKFKKIESKSKFIQHKVFKDGTIEYIE
jgi:hypothetical protein